MSAKRKAALENKENVRSFDARSSDLFIIIHLSS